MLRQTRRLNAEKQKALVFPISYHETCEHANISPEENEVNVNFFSDFAVTALTLLGVCHRVQLRNEGRRQDDGVHHVLKLHLDTLKASRRLRDRHAYLLNGGMNAVRETDPLPCSRPPPGHLDVPTSDAGTRPDCRAAATPPARHGNAATQTFDP